MSNSGTISVVNAASTIPLTLGSYVPIASGPGQGSVTIQVAAGMGTLTLGVLVSLNGTDFSILTPSSITKTSDGSTGAITASGTYTVPVSAGTVYVYCSAYTSGSAVVMLSSGLGTGTPGAAGGGDAVVANQGSPGSSAWPITGNPLTQYKSAATITANLVAGAKKLKQISAQNASATSLYLQLFDSTGSTGGAIVFEMPVTFGISTSATENTRSFSPDYIAFATGVTFGFSTTSGTYTAVGSGTGLRVDVEVA